MDDLLGDMTIDEFNRIADYYHGHGLMMPSDNTVMDVYTGSSITVTCELETDGMQFHSYAQIN